MLTGIVSADRMDQIMHCSSTRRGLRRHAGPYPDRCDVSELVTSVASSSAAIPSTPDRLDGDLGPVFSTRSA
jgi:hypothetical protein